LVKVDDAATSAVRVHWPAPTKFTVEPLTVQTELVDDVTENTVPFPEVVKLGVNWPP
jgi:hypothetical protein